MPLSVRSSFIRLFSIHILFIALILSAFSGRAQAPSISSFSPVSAAQFSSVMITGSNFTGTTAVKFGGTPATSFFLLSPTQILATVGTGASGDVTVTTANGTATKPGFTFIPKPVIQSFSPVTGGLNTIVTIRGSIFTGANGVTFGNVPALSFTVLSDTMITAVVGAGNSGVVRVSGPGNTGFLSGFTHLGPAIISYSPQTGPPGTTVTITGNNFTGTTAVTFGAIPASSFTVNSATSITAVTSPGAAGNIAVTSPAGTGTATGFNLPKMTSFLPTNGTLGTTVTIRGIKLTNATAVYFGDIPAQSFSVLSDTVITAVVGYGASGHVKVSNTYGADSLSFFSYAYPPPTFSSFAPGSGKQGDTITIRGTNLFTTFLVSFNGTSAATVINLSDTLIKAVVGPGASGNIMVYTPGGDASLPGFIFTGPIIQYFSPTSAAAGETVNIYGTGFTGATGVSFGNTAAAGFTVVSSTNISALVGNGSPGSVVVTTPQGSATQSGFSMKPVISSFTPATGAAGDTIMVRGKFLTNTYIVKVGNFNAASFTVMSDSTIQVILGNSTTGSIKITTPAGTAELAGFTFIYAPVILETFPSFGGAGTTLTVIGGAFTGATEVKVGGTPVASFVVVNDNRIEAIVAAGDTGAISVKTPGGTRSGGNFFFFEKPVITSFSPAQGGPGTILTLRGHHLNATVIFEVGYAQYFTARVGGVAAARAAANSDSLAYAHVTSGSSGFITVETPGGKDSLPGFTFLPVPVLQSFSPMSGNVGSTVTITGSNFSSVALNNIVVFGGVKAVVTAATPTTLTVTVPTGCGFEPISVSVNGLTAYSKKPFVRTYPGAAGFTADSYKERTDISVGYKPKALLGDIDGDGKLDMVVGNYDNSKIDIYLNTSTYDSISFATAVSIPTAAHPLIQAVQDENGDGKLDILIIADTIDIGNRQKSYTFRNTTIGNAISFINANGNARPFAPRVNIPVFADFNADGKTDILYHESGQAYMGIEYFYYYMRTNDENLETYWSSNYFLLNNVPSDMSVARKIIPYDMNADGKIDFVIGWQGQTSAYHFSIIGNIATPWHYEFVPSIKFISSPNNKTYNPQVGDLNLDSLPDMLRDNTAYINTGNLNFSQQANTCIDCEFIDDMDGDGRPDLVRFANDSFGIVRNVSSNGIVTLAPKVNFYTGAHASYYSIGDLNGDGKPEIVVSRFEDQTISILRNKVGETIRLCPGGNAIIGSNLTGSNYQWQQNRGNGFTNLVNNGSFSGTNTDTLFINNTPDSTYGYQYRCVVDGSNSYTYTIRFENTWLGSVSTAWENPANWACNSIPAGNTDVVINSGNIVISSNAVCGSLTVGPGVSVTVMPGFNFTILH